jgi:hypothetical protein
VSSYRIVLTDGSHYDLDADTIEPVKENGQDWYRFSLAQEVVGQFSSGNVVAWWRASKKEDLDTIVDKSVASIAAVQTP